MEIELDDESNNREFDEIYSMTNELGLMMTNSVTKESEAEESDDVNEAELEEVEMGEVGSITNDSKLVIRISADVWAKIALEKLDLN